MARLRSMTISVLIVAAAALFGLSALAAAPPFPVKWEGVLALMPQGAGYEAACAYNGKVYVFGGAFTSWDGADNYSYHFISDVQIYDPALDAWTAGPDGTDIGAYASAAEAGGLIYVMGGLISDDGTLVNSNRVYDPSGNTWLANKAAMPDARRGHGACAVNGKIYVFGGKDDSNSVTKTVSIYDPASDSWSSGAAMPYKAAYGAAVWVPSKGRVYYIGGWDGGSLYYSSAITYDPAANAWDTAQIPLLTGADVFACAFDPNTGKIGIFSGMSQDANGQFVVPQTQVLDTATNTVSEGALMISPMARTGAVGACVGGKMYVIGADDGFCARLVDVYDPASDTWYDPNPTFPTYDVGLAVKAVGGKVYALSGAGYSFNDKVYVLDPAGGAWTTTSAVNPKPRLYVTSSVYDGKIIVADGWDGAMKFPGDTYLYDPATDAFSDLAPDPTGRVWAAGAVANGVFYVFGGYNGKHLATANALDIASNTWSSKKAMPLAIRNLCACASGGKVYLFGGQFATDVLSPNFYSYNPATDSYQDLGPMPLKIYGGDCTVYGKYILVLGDADGVPGLVQVYDPAANVWYTAASPFDREWGGVAVAAGRLYWVGGELYYYSSTGITGDLAVDRTLIANLSDLAATASADPASGGIPLTVNFTAHVTGGVAPFSYDWDFKDGSAHATTADPSHTFTAIDTYNVALAVTDANGAVSVAHVQVTAGLPPPVISTMEKLGSPFRFFVTGSNFQSGIQVFIGSDTTPWPTVTYMSPTQISIGKGKKLKAKVPKGVDTVFHFVNPDGGTADFTWHW